jgi:hypothetical protein
MARKGTGWRFAARLERLPGGQDLMPEQGGEKEARRDRFAFSTRRSVAFQREHDEAFAERLIENHVEQWQHARGAVPLRAARDAAQRHARGEQLEHLVEQARGRHVVEQICHLADRPPRLGSMARLDLGRQAHGTQHAHRVFAVAGLRVADHAQGFLLQVGDAVVVIDDGFGLGS